MYELTPNELQALLDTSDGYSDLLRKVGLNPKGGNPKTLKKIIKEYNLDETQLNKNRNKLYSRNHIYAKIKNKIPIEDIFSNKCHYRSSHNLLKRLINEGYKEYCCEECGISDWMGKPLSLQLEHIDGNHNNNNLDNLKILCPNCHSQTNTFAGKNIKRIKRNKRIKYIRKIKKTTLPPISREDLKELIRNKPFVQIGKQFGVTDNAVRKWCDKYKLPRKVSDIKKYTNEEWRDI